MTVEELLRIAGVSRCYRGFIYFSDAVNLVLHDGKHLQDIRREIYIPLAEKYHVEPKNVERNIRTVRDVIMRDPDRKFLRMLTNGTFTDLTKMYPRELIETFADYLRSHQD